MRFARVAFIVFLGCWALCGDSDLGSSQVFAAPQGGAIPIPMQGVLKANTYVMRRDERPATPVQP